MSTWSEWRKKFKFKYILRGEWFPSVAFPTDLYDYQDTNGTTPTNYVFTILRDALFGEIDNINASLAGAALALEVDFLSYDAEGNRQLTNDSTNKIEWDDPDDTETPTTASGYLDPSFGYTYYSLYSKLSSLGNFDPADKGVGECPEYTVYVTLKLSDEYILNDKPTFIWKFYTDFDAKTRNELSETTTDKLDIFGNPIPPTVPQLKQKNTNGTYTFYTCTDWERQADRSFLAIYTATTVKSLFTVDDKDIFEDAEPYYYGKKAPISGYFLPIGDNDNTSDNTDILIQSPEDDNVYSEIVNIEGFTVFQSEDPLQYIKKGTFPMFRASNETDSNTSVKIEYQSGERKPSRISMGAAEPFNAYPEIKRLGFILVGAGGGAGGFARYDDCSSGSTEEYACPGAGGGGGEIVCGVLNVEAPPISEEYNGYFVLGQSLGLSGTGIQKVEITSLEFKPSLGTGGSPGTSDYNDGGSAGTDGGSSYLSLTVNSRYTLDNSTWHTLSFTKNTIIKAAGGCGGSKGTIDTAVITGGVGGTSGHDASKKFFTDNWCVVCYAINGGDGASINIDPGNSYQNSSSTGTAAFSRNLYFSPQEASNSDTYCKMITHGQVEATISIKKEDGVDKIEGCMIPGGHSFGSGAADGGTRPTRGGGGCGGTLTNLGAYGGNGFFGVYY